MRLWYGIVFLLLLALLPELAHAFTKFTVSPGGCGDIGAFQLDCDNDPKNGLFSAVACKTMKVYNAAILPLYCNLTGNKDFLNGLSALLSLYIIFWGITYLFGLTTVTTGNATSRLLKFVFIFFFLTNQSLFFSMIYENVLKLPEFIIGVVLQANAPEGGVAETTFYRHVDKGIHDLLNSVFYPELANGSTAKKADLRIFVLGLAIWKLIPGGGFLAGMFFSVVVGWMGAYLSIMIRYLLAIMALIFLLMLGPIFISSLLFEKTKYLGEEWIKMLNSFMLQMVIMVTFVLMIEDFYVEFYEMIKVGFNRIVLERNNAVGYNLDYGSLTKVEKEFGITFASSQKYLEDADLKAPKGQEFLPWFVAKMAVMAAVLYLTVTFLKFVPAFAGFLSGAPRFISLMNRSKDIVSSEGSRTRLPFDNFGAKLKQKLDNTGGGATRGGPLQARSQPQGREGIIRVTGDDAL